MRRVTITAICLVLFCLTGEAREVQANLSVLSLSSFVLENDAYSVRYSDKLTGLPRVSLGVAETLGELGPVLVTGFAHVGFSGREGMMPVVARDGRSREEKVAVSLVPVTLSTRFLYELPGVRFVKPTLTAGIGLAWARQHSLAEGLSTSFWLPHYFFRPGLSFFDVAGSDSPDQWFAGFTFGIAFQDTFGTRQRLRAWSFDLSVNFIL